jgi:hypothetical protein
MSETVWDAHGDVDVLGRIDTGQFGTQQVVGLSHVILEPDQMAWTVGPPVTESPSTDPTKPGSHERGR